VIWTSPCSSLCNSLPLYSGAYVCLRAYMGLCPLPKLKRLAPSPHQIPRLIATPQYVQNNKLNRIGLIDATAASPLPRAHSMQHKAYCDSHEADIELSRETSDSETNENNLNHIGNTPPADNWNGNVSSTDVWSNCYASFGAELRIQGSFSNCHKLRMALWAVKQPPHMFNFSTGPTQRLLNT